MQTSTDARRAFVVAIMNRLRRHYAEHTSLPARDDGETLSACRCPYWRVCVGEGRPDLVRNTTESSAPPHSTVSRLC
jgi:hypothetical protein